MNTPAPTRRQFLFGISAVAGGLLVGLPESRAQTGHGEVTAWVVITPDDTVTIRVARSDMGQGIFTALPMLVAEELECDWAKVRAEYADTNENLTRDKPWGDMVTSTSISVRASQEYLRQAGAQAREMLIAEAAARWNVTPVSCRARGGIVSHAASGRALRFGALAAAAARRPIPENVPLKAPSDWRLIGTSAARIEAAPKVFAEPIFATDVDLPGMLHAAVKNCPTIGGSVVAFDHAAVAGLPGVRHVVQVGKDAVAVVADSWRQANAAVEALPVTWDESIGTGVSNATLRTLFREGLADPAAAIGHRIDDVGASLGGAAQIIDVEYEAPFLAHATMEPQVCTAKVTAERIDLWAPTQNGEGTTNTIARVMQRDAAQIFVHKLQLGGGFGRRGLAQDWARQSVQIAAQVPGVPVRMLWSREEDFTHDYYRPMVLARQTAGFDAQGRLLGWKVRISGSSIAASLAPFWLKEGVDNALMDGFVEEDMPYAVASFEVGVARRDSHIPVGFWRGVNLSQNGWFREAFLDEIAAMRKIDPYLLRRELLSENPRALATLDAAAKLAGWGKPPAGRHQGIAIVEGDNAWCAQIAEISVTDGRLKVHRISCAVDPNFVVHPDITVQQIEGGIVQGLAAALYGEVTVEDGRVQQTNFHNYRYLRMEEMPVIDVALVPSLGRYGDRWGGVGETGLPPLAPALTNAIHPATGKRLRSLPISNHDLRV
ncbi:molybdopterin-dependent oxidoreductase [Shinella sp. CPCC 101442]|uniref:xanthine dehydrogenase family protein molybdopterin-binding subunit n=1 Tax=Shinella sp. CPCC 101442 TaxID=2932265 RepID=UPI002152324C|nr:molybdopterin cofactor-binding domain-containing protein [Shinella sp. CPCC 101442]MCR6502938.1 molybdopterin-dependent oxidoreductase [Shinella sp. CPCC 101442]